MELTGQAVTQKIRKSLGEQLELLSGASRKCKPCDLVRLSEAMVLVVRELKSN